jgi:hypothetical protein
MTRGNLCTCDAIGSLFLDQELLLSDQFCEPHHGLFNVVHWHHRVGQTNVWTGFAGLGHKCVSGNQHDVLFQSSLHHHVHHIVHTAHFDPQKHATARQLPVSQT